MNRFFLPPNTNTEEKPRRVLAKIYALLIKLAEDEPFEKVIEPALNTELLKSNTPSEV